MSFTEIWFSADIYYHRMHQHEKWPLSGRLHLSIVGKLCALQVKAKYFLVFSKSIVEFLKLLRSVEIIAEIQKREYKYV
jgi:hypothetical protein